MKQIPRTVIQIIFVISEEEGHLSSLSKGRETKSKTRKIAKRQKLPKVGEWINLLTNSNNKCL